MPTHAAPPTILAALAATVVLVVPTQAPQEVSPARVTGPAGAVTVRGGAQGAPLEVLFVDATPSGADRYRLRLVEHAGDADATWSRDEVDLAAVAPTAFTAALRPDDLRPGECYEITVEEVDDHGVVVAASAPTSWTFVAAGP